MRQGGIQLYEKAARQSESETLLLQDELGKFNAHPSSDGRYLAYVAGGGIIARSDIWILPLFDGKKAFAYLESAFIESQPQFSPDGRWLAFMSNKSGRPEVYVSSFPGRDSERLISTAGGQLPRWNRNGNEIFYVAPDGMLTATIVNGSGPRFEVGAASPLFRIRQRPARLDSYSYDVDSKGARFLVNTLIEEVMPPISLIVNWPGTR
jgi:dipeptidyl aminopeptidase/acylaminoacyl peptidase